MNDTLPCPGCHTPLLPEATGCHICMRARTKQEIVRGYAKLREEQARRKSRPFKILAAVLFVGGAGWLVARFQTPLIAGARSAKRHTAAWYDRFVDAHSYAPAKPADAETAVSPDAATTKSPFATPVTVPSELRPASGPAPAPFAGGPAGAAPTPVAPAKPPVPKNSWLVTGTVYDIDNLEPAKQATITFTRETFPKVVVKTNDEGVYEAVLVKGEGWTALVEVRNRRRGQVADLEPPYRARDEDERRAAFEHISDGDLAPAAITGKTSASTLHRDFVTFPQSWANGPVYR